MKNIQHESNGNRNKTLSVEEYLDKFRPYLKDIDNLKKPDVWKIQLAIAINFISSKDNVEEYVMDSKIDNIEIMVNDRADEVIKGFFESLRNRYQNNLESMKDSEFAFNYVHLLFYKCHIINPNCGGSYIDSPVSIKIQKAAINPINKKKVNAFNTLQHSWRN